LFLNILVFIIAFIYWYLTTYEVPAILGIIFILISLYADKLYFVSMFMGIITLLSIVFFVFNNPSTQEMALSQVTINALYMLVVFFKSKSLFDAD